MNRTYTRLSESDRKEIAALYVAGMEVKQIARRKNCSPASVYSALKAQQIARRHPGPITGSGISKGPIYDNPYLVAKVQLCKRLYNEEGFRVYELMRIFGRCRTTISDYLNRPDQPVGDRWIDLVQEQYEAGQLASAEH